MSMVEICVALCVAVAVGAVAFMLYPKMKERALVSQAARDNEELAQAIRASFAAGGDYRTLTPLWLAKSREIPPSLLEGVARGGAPRNAWGGPIAVSSAKATGTGGDSHFAIRLDEVPARGCAGLSVASAGFSRVDVNGNRLDFDRGETRERAESLCSEELNTVVLTGR